MAKQAFDQKKQREMLLGDGTRLSLISYSLSLDFDDVRKHRAFAGTAGGMLTDVIYGWLVSLDREVQPLLQRAHEWMRLGLEAGEAGGNVGGPGGVHEMAALSEWLLFNRHDAENYRRAADHHEAHLRAEFLDKKKPADTKTLDVFMRNCVQAGDYPRALSFYELAVGADAQAEQNLKKIKSERGLCYAICRAQIDPGQGGAALEDAERRFLRGQMKTWLDNGWAKDAAHWLKIVFWNNRDPRLAPADVVRKAYDYL